MSEQVIWIEADRLGDHVHLKVSTGRQYGQPDGPNYDGGRRHRNDAGGAGQLIVRADQWPSFIRALAVGGHATGLRVMWRYSPDDGRYLWNGAADAPCIVGEHEPVGWERTLEVESAGHRRPA